ncbi:hypothetical protein K8352_13975 [Flavobacteriaceae bacterium F89]|uniref:Uncharacterized protein n=1 Tax=Cerina litoralis TaxID=2874477 RepID=A0AAE3JRY4_9FLAO|nr:hypothetical protein [Cerina litoralis]MCG2461863.1 hypothetical protein [Cerina litoralis]
MKNIIIALALLMGTVGTTKAQDVQKAVIVIATYSGNSTDGYYFTNDLDQRGILFAQIEPEVLNKYDLNNNTFLNKTFRVTYIIDTEAGKAPDPKGPKKIIDLTLINQSDDE